jgi:hypothetical protein
MGMLVVAAAVAGCDTTHTSDSIDAFVYIAVVDGKGMADAEQQQGASRGAARGIPPGRLPSCHGTHPRTHDGPRIPSMEAQASWLSAA